MRNKPTLLYGDVKEKDRFLIGEKAYNLSKIPKSKIYFIPKWFVLTTYALDYFLESNGMQKGDKHREVARIIKNGLFPKDLEKEIMNMHKMLGVKFVAVRSSSRVEDKAKSFAGFFTTTIGVKKEKLLEAVKNTWLSAYTTEKPAGMAVIVQELIESEISGVAFTNASTNNLVIEAVFGQGESLVSGEVTPDYYSIAPNGNIFNMEIKNQPWCLKADNGTLVKVPLGGKSLNMKIEPANLKLLNMAAKVVQRGKGGSRDIEFAIQSDKLFILQDRPGKKILDRKVKLNVYNRRESSLIFLPSIMETQDRDAYVKTKIKPRSISIFKKETGFFDKYAFVFEYNLIFFKLKELYSTDVKRVNKDLKNIENQFFQFQNLLNENKIHSSLSLKLFNSLHSKVVDVYVNFTLLNVFLQIGDKKVKNRVITVRKFAESNLYLVINIIEEFLKRDFPKYLKFLPVMEKDDIIKLIKRKTITISRVTELNNRLKGAFLFEGEIYTINKLESVLKKNHLEIINENKLSKDKFISGSVVFSGIVKGKVRVIHSRKDCENFKKGEILVVHMTSVNMLEAIKISSAIVTDEGGVLCHAAINAREYKKPCIVGTQTATAYLKTGDKVIFNTKTNRVSLA